MTSSDIRALAKRLAELERRLKGAERGSRLQYSSVLLGDGANLNVPRALAAGADAPAKMAAALAATIPLADVSDGLLTVYFTEILPAAGNTGDLWLMRPENALRRYDGTSWQALDDQATADAIAGAYGDLSTEDGFIDTYWTTTAPGSGLIGDLWFRIDNGNAPHRWDGTGWQALGVSEAQSVTYQPGAAGWGFKANGDGQVADLQVLGQLGATGPVSAPQVLLNGEDLGAILAALPRGTIADASRGGLTSVTNAGDTSGTTEKILFEFNVGDLEAGRLYRVMLHGHYQGSVAGDAFDLRVRRTTDGTAPTITSPAFYGGVKRLNVPAAGSDDFAGWFEFSPGVDASYRMALTAQRGTGTGVMRVYLLQEDRRFEWTVDDCGLYANAQLPTALAQKAKQNGDPPDGTPGQVYTRVWSATWGQSYNHAGGFSDLFLPPSYSVRSGDLYQGYNPANNFHDTASDRSLIGFNYTDIVATLAGATEIVGAYLTFTPRYRRSNFGLDVHVLKHNYTAKPAEFSVTFPNGNVTEDIAEKLNAVPGTIAKIPLGLDNGVAVGEEFQAGTIRGLGFVGTVDHPQHDGYMYGANHALRPVLTIEFKA